jgi:hypothetical protein
LELEAASGSADDKVRWGGGFDGEAAAPTAPEEVVAVTAAGGKEASGVTRRLPSRLVDAQKKELSLAASATLVMASRWLRTNADKATHDIFFNEGCSFSSSAFFSSNF